MLAMLATTTHEHDKDWKATKQKSVSQVSIYVSTGYLPFFMMNGRKAKIPLDIIYGIPTISSATLSNVSALCQSLENSY